MQPDAFELGEQVFQALTGRDQPPWQKGKFDALRSGIELAAMAVDALARIADALEVHKPLSPVDNAHDGL